MSGADDRWLGLVGGLMVAELVGGAWQRGSGTHSLYLRFSSLSTEAADLSALGRRIPSPHLSAPFSCIAHSPFQLAFFAPFPSASRSLRPCLLGPLQIRGPCDLTPRLLQRRQVLPEQIPKSISYPLQPAPSLCATRSS